MAAPTFVSKYETAWGTTTTPKTSPSITTQVGDVLAVMAATSDGATTLGSISNTGTAETWTLRQSSAVGGQTAGYAWTAVCATAQTMTVSLVSAGNTSNLWGFNVLQFRASNGVGANAIAVTSTTSSVALTTTQANSAVICLNADWNGIDGTTRTWLTVNVAATEETYFRDAAFATIYIAYWSDVGAAAANTFGLSAPTGQSSTDIAVEIKGASAVAAATPQPFVSRAALQRASTW